MMTDEEYHVKQLGSWLQDLGRYLIEHPEMIEKATMKYSPDLSVDWGTRSYISYENKCILEIEVQTK